MSEPKESDGVSAEVHDPYVSFVPHPNILYANGKSYRIGIDVIPADVSFPSLTEPDEDEDETSDLDDLLATIRAYRGFLRRTMELNLDALVEGRIDPSLVPSFKVAMGVVSALTKEFDRLFVTPE